MAKLLSAQRDTTQRQLNAEKNKRTEGPRIESLNNRLFDTHDKINVLDEMMRKVFTGYVYGLGSHCTFCSLHHVPVSKPVNSMASKRV